MCDIRKNQKAVAALEMLPHLEREAKERQGANSNLSHDKQLIAEHDKGQARESGNGLEPVRDSAPTLADLGIRKGSLSFKGLTIKPKTDKPKKKQDHS